MRLTQLLLILCVMNIFAVHAQHNTDSINAIPAKLTTKYITEIGEKSDRAVAKLDRQTERYLSKLQRQEARLQQKLSRIDSASARRIFDGASQQYQEIHRKLNNKSAELLQKSGQYFPWLDSASTSLKYLASPNPLMSNLKDDAGRIKSALGKVNELKDQFKKAASVKEFVRERRVYLSEQLSQYNLGKELKKYSKTAYYYSHQINEYKSALTDSKKAERKALELLNKLPAFTDFMKKNSLLASMFRIVPEDPGDPAYLQSLAGLQTRTQVTQLVESQLGTAAISGMQQMQSSLQQVQGPLNQLKDRVLKYGSGGNGEEMPDYNVNNQKTKSFLNRLEYGTNMQTTRSNYFFPTTTDLALLVGYKLNDKSIAGVGMSYKMGWGRDIKHISFSSQGLGLRSFVDIKLKGNFYASGGFEYNYQQAFNSARELYNIDGWQQSGLLGVSKILSVKSNVFKNTKLQLFWDMLSYKQVPRAQAFKFRVGYSF